MLILDENKDHGDIWPMTLMKLLKYPNECKVGNRAIVNQRMLISDCIVA